MPSLAVSPPMLSASDAIILNRLFDPEAAPDASVSIDPHATQGPSNIPNSALSTLQSNETLIVRNLEATLSSSSFRDVPFSPAIDAAIDTAIAALSSIITSHPTYASAYLNRAQALRLKIGNHLLSACTSDTFAASTLLADLATAITLSTPSSPNAPISPAQAKLLANAHTLRATLLHTAAKDLQGGEERVVRSAGELGEEQDREGGELGEADGSKFENAQELEQRASHDFFLGGRYGNPIARAMAVQINPSAKLCGAIVQEAMRREYGV